MTVTKRGCISEAARITAMLRDPIADVWAIELSPSHVALYRDERLTKLSGPTARRELTILRHCVEIARKEWGIATRGNPVADVKRPNDSRGRNRRLPLTTLNGSRRLFASAVMLLSFTYSSSPSPQECAGVKSLASHGTTLMRRTG